MIETNWSAELSEHLLDILMSFVEWEQKDVTMSNKSTTSANVNLLSCLREFKVTETLDEENKWFCSECKDHVIATKTMELYRAPPILIITLKRFKAGGGGNRYGMMSMGGGFGGQKLETVVDFPLKGLDMREFVLCTEQR